MRLLYTFACDTPAIDTESAVVVSSFNTYSTGLEELNGYEARVQSGATVELQFGYYRTPVIKLGKITWSDDQRIRPLLSEGDQVEFQETPRGFLVWCPASEWDEVVTALAVEQREQRELEEDAHLPDIRIIHDNELHLTNPRVVWSGWHRKKLHSFSGVLPRGFEGHVIQQYNPREHCWELDHDSEVTFGQIVNTPHAKKEERV